MASFRAQSPQPTLLFRSITAGQHAFKAARLNLAKCKVAHTFYPLSQSFITGLTSIIAKKKPLTIVNQLVSDYTAEVTSGFEPLYPVLQTGD